ncbi:unnamed protein product, partial [Chrysoparadoxa australica]
MQMSFSLLCCHPSSFTQGYSLKKRNFFKYFHYIFSFGILGTLIQFSVITVLALKISSWEYFNILRDDDVAIGLSLHECMLIAAVFSAADEVATLSLIKQHQYPKLSAVLFGEGVLNDAMSILLFHAVTVSTVGVGKLTGRSAALSAVTILAQAMYLLITAGSLGVVTALGVSRLLKIMPSLSESPVRQVAILMLGGYFSFSLAEALHLSGILAVFFCGFTMSHYAWHSLSPDAKTTSKITSDTISMVAEAYCFAAIGLSVHEFDMDKWCFGFIAAMVLVLMVARAISMYGICLVGWLVHSKSWSVPMEEQHVLYFGGLVRGAIAWAQVVQVHDPHRGVMVTTTLGVILFTTVFFGATMPFFTQHLKPEEETTGPEQPNRTATLTVKATDGERIEPHHIDLQIPLGDADSLEARVAEVDANESANSVSTFSAIVWPERAGLHGWWVDIDNRFMRPLFGARDPEAAELVEQWVDHRSDGSLLLSERTSYAAYPRSSSKKLRARIFPNPESYRSNYHSGNEDITFNIGNGGPGRYGAMGDSYTLESDPETIYDDASMVDSTVGDLEYSTTGEGEG